MLLILFLQNKLLFLWQFIIHKNEERLRRFSRIRAQLRPVGGFWFENKSLIEEGDGLD